MSRVLLITFFLVQIKLVSQTISQINNNNAHAYLMDNGVFFSNLVSNTAGYEIPTGSGNKTTYAMSFWMGGLDLSNQLHFAGQTSGYNPEFYPGPIANDYNSTYYTTNFSSAIWKVTKSAINYHLNNFTAVGYVPDPSIANWPGNGNVSEGVSAQLAPYIDMNGDQIYNPLDGDYPYIQGDEAVYVIFNDAAGNHMMTGGEALGVEIHVMFFQFSTSDAINNTTFMNVKIYNRSTISYHDFYFGLWMDYDLGQSNNDYLGCDSLRNLSYVYNGMDSDFGQSGQPGYGPNTPAFGTVLLNQSLGTFLTYNLGGGANGDPSVAPFYYNYLKGYWQNGAHILYGGNGYNSGTTTTESNFMYSGNPFTASGWNEITEGNPPGDRRGIMSTTSNDLLPGESLCFDFAFIYNRDGNNYLENVNELLNTADFVQNFYDNQIQPCNQIFLDKIDYNQQAVSIYPNPSNGIFSITIDENAAISIYNMNGELMMSENILPGSTEINLNLSNGFYLIQIKTNHTNSYHKIEIIK